MKGPSAGDGRSAWKRSAWWCTVTFLLSAAHTAALYGPWGIAAAAAAGGHGQGVWALLGAVAGALVFFNFQTGLRFAASAVLAFAVNLAFCDTALYRRRGFAPLLAALSLFAVQTVYLAGRGIAEWALCALCAAIAAAVAWAMGHQQRKVRLLAVFSAAAAALSHVELAGFSPGGVVTAWLALACGVSLPPGTAAALACGVGLCADLARPSPQLLAAAVCGSGALAASLLRRARRPVQAAAFTLAGMLAALALDVDRPWMVLYEIASGAAAYLLVGRQWLPGKETTPQAVPAMASNTAVWKGAAAFRQLYDAMFRTRPTEKGENPAVIFDRAAEQVCRKCLLVTRCWQTEYNQTYGAFNDACGPMLRRGRAEAEDFSLFFTSRCLHFPQLLAAVNAELYAFRLRRQYRARLEDIRELAEVQYEHLGEALGDSAPAEEAAVPILRCRVGTMLRPKEGETACGDQLAVFTVGNTLYMLLSDGMGSGTAAHAESAMTVRLLRSFLKAGIRPRPALKTINTALTLRCQEGGAFTTIDLLALDRATGGATLYKYGAAPSYVKKDGTVSRLDGGSLPAGLQDARQPPEATGLSLEAGNVLVMVSDGITGGDGDTWLRTLLERWPGGDSRELAQMILAESRCHGGLQDDCAALVLRLEKTEESRPRRV